MQFMTTFKVSRESFLIIGVDFHGVICDHPEKSKGLTEPDWPAVPGAIDWLKSITERFDVHLVSARFSRPGREGADAISKARHWLSLRGIPPIWTMTIEGPARIWLTPFKPPCSLWIDDRAWCFRGTFPTADEIDSFRPWNR